MSVDLFVNFNGNCREAVSFYAEVFGKDMPEFMTFGDAPQDPEYPLDDQTKGLVMYTALSIHGTNIMFSDIPPEMPFIAGNNISIAIVSKDTEETKTLFHKMKEGATIIMDLQETFWSKCYGYLTDKFGISWQFSLSSEEK